MLEGFDRDWIENGTRNSATYTSLPAGDYTLRVQGANSAGIWNREGLSLSIQVLPAPWLTWWAFTLYGLGTLFLIWLGARAYVSYELERRARELAVKMVEAEAHADDEMQEQLEIHDDLVKSVYRHSVSTLNLVGELISTKGSYLSDDNACEVVQASISRVDALAILEECLYYQNEILLADLNKYTNILVSKLLKKSPVGEENIVTINEVTSQPFPIEQASPLAIALFELLENAIQHAFEETGQANYLHIVLAPEGPALTDAHYRLVVQDNGPGIPPNIDPLTADTSGLAIVSSMAKRLSGELSFANRNGTVVSISFPRAGATR
jgi:two-component sensor histidine kinase